MLRIISLFLLLIISRVSSAETIAATSTSSVSSFTYQGHTESSHAAICSWISTNIAGRTVSTWYMASVSTPYRCYNPASYSYYNLTTNSSTTYSCPSGYAQTDSTGNADSSGAFCSKSACADAAGTSYSLWVSATNAPTTGCYAGCTVTANVVASFPNSTAVYQLQSYTMKDEVCPASNIDYVDAATAEAANTAAAKAKALEDAKAACGDAGYTVGTANGETVVTCKVPDSPSTSTDTSTGTDSTSSGMGTDAGSPETNTSGTQNSTVGGGTGSLGGSGYGEGGTSGSGTDSGGTSGSGTDSGGASGSGTDSGGTSGSGTDSGGTSGSGTDSGGASGSGTDSGGTSGSGTDSGGASGSGTDSGGTSGSGTDSGGTSGSGTDSGGTSGSGTDSGSGSGSGSDSGSGSGSGTGEETEEESDESGSYPGADISFDYADTERETRTVTDVFKENYEKFKTTELVSSATGFFTVNLSGGACSVISVPFFAWSIVFDPCAFLEYATALMRIAVLFACSFFAFRIAME